MRRIQKVVLGAAVTLGAIQLVPVSRTNPPVEVDVAAPADVKALLRRACYDCHSHETVWPLQAYVAPASWLVVHDVIDGREELDFSRWSNLPPSRLAKLAKGIRKEVETKQEMPPWYYVLAHPHAKLSDAERQAIAAWADGLPATAAP